MVVGWVRLPLEALPATYGGWFREGNAMNRVKKFLKTPAFSFEYEGPVQTCKVWIDWGPLLLWVAVITLVVIL